MVSVAVLPIQGDIQGLKDADVEVTTCGGHGPGGQHQNKTDSAVRMRHAPTGLTVFINGRSQHANRREARRILAARVAAMMRERADAEYSGERRAQMDGGGRGNKVRTYNFMDGRVVDHRLGRKTGQIRRVMRGEFRLIFGD